MRKAEAKDALRGDDETDGKAAASCRTPNKKWQPRLPLLQTSQSLTCKYYTTSALTGRGEPWERAGLADTSGEFDENGGE